MVHIHCKASGQNESLAHGADTFGDAGLLTIIVLIVILIRDVS
jgi:hypothetical protein